MASFLLFLTAIVYVGDIRLANDMVVVEGVVSGRAQRIQKLSSRRIFDFVLSGSFPAKKNEARTFPAAMANSKGSAP